MVFSGRQTIISILLLLSPVVCAQSQSAVDKAATSTISGKVLAGGKGQSGVVVVLVTSDQARNFRPTRFRSITDEDGSYRITKVPPGTYKVIPASPAYVATEDSKSINLGENEIVEKIDITFELGGVITGKVTDSEGRPVIEEVVYVSAAATTARGPFYFRNIRTDDRGIYRAYGVPAGSYRVSAGRDTSSSVGSRRQDGGYQRTYHPSSVDPAAAIVIHVSEGSEATNVDITFDGPARSYTARGRIIDRDTGQPLPNTRVGVQMFLQDGGISATGGVAESNKNGEFRIENMAPGKYAVYSEPPADSDWHSEAVKFEMTDRDVEGLVIKTARGTSVSGVVVLEGTDDANVRASLLTTRLVGQIVGSYLGRSEPSATINPNGSFRLLGLASGRLALHLQPREPFRVIRLERAGIVYPDGLEIKEQEQVTDLRVVVAHANGAIRGVIQLPVGLELPAIARLRVFIRRTDVNIPGFYIAPVEADARGHFRVERLTPGTYEIVISVSMKAPPSQSPNVQPKKETVVVTNGAVTDVTITVEMPEPVVSKP